MLSWTRLSGRLNCVKTCLAAVAVAVAASAAWTPAPEPARAVVIVQAHDTAAALAAVEAAGGHVTHELGIIDAVAAPLSAQELERVRASCPTCRVLANHEVRFAGLDSPSSDPGGAPDTSFPTLIGAARLHAEGHFGSGVTVAVLDTGFWANAGLSKDHLSSARVLKQYNAFTNTTHSKLTSDDDSGHGAHVTGIAGSSNTSYTQLYHGVAPGASLVTVKAFRADGSSTYADVIRGIDWVVANRTKYNIRVLNCSFSAPVRSWYWEDPLNQAVMKAWRAGIVVVASAGNRGPDPQTIGVPGNVPYVVTVGAMSDNFTPADGSDDRLATWSSTGPTFEGFVKPDLVAPGGHVLSLMEKSDYLPTQYPQFHDGNVYFTMSGTSQAAAVVSGVAAQILSASPNLRNDDVKCALIASARVAYDYDQDHESQGPGPAYSIFQQGAGVVDAYGAVYSGETGCANQGLSIDAEFAKKPTHYVGIAYQDDTGLYRLYNEGGLGRSWNGVYNGVTGYPWSSGFPWTNGYPWTNSFSWTSGYPWSSSYASSTTWTSGYPWTNGYPWSNSLTEAASINLWVPQE